jgi:hypothetical protein
MIKNGHLSAVFLPRKAKPSHGVYRAHHFRSAGYLFPVVSDHLQRSKWTYS